jgi:signal transduction histidine kinase
MIFRKYVQYFGKFAGSVSVRIKILGIILGMVILLGVVVIIQTRQALTKTLTDQLQNESVSISRDLAARATDPILLNDLLHLQDLLNEIIANNPNVRYAFIVDAHGQVIANSFGNGFPNNLLPLNSVMPNDHHHTALIQSNEGLIWDTAVPILNEKVGIARVGISDASLRAALSALTARIVLTIALVSAMGILVAIFLTWMLTRPILSLVKATQLVAKGDFSQRIQHWANDEIGELSIAFNEMTSELAHTNELRNEREGLRRQLMEKVISTQEDERRRIARELHDSTSQNLTSLIVGLRMMETNCAHCSASLKATNLREIASKTLEEIHELSIWLRPRVLDDLGLEAALEHLVYDWQAHYKIPVDVIIQLSDRLPSDIETALFRIVQEALTNIARHARAQTVSILIERHVEFVRAIVEDDGIGFNINVNHNGQQLGLLGMRERAELLGGILTIESAPEHGTSIYVELPLRHLGSVTPGDLTGGIDA